MSPYLSMWLLVGACASSRPSPVLSPPPTEATPRPASDAQAEALDAFFAEVWERRLAADPVRRTYMGIGKSHGEWGDLSDAGREASIEAAIDDLARMRATFDLASLTPQDQLSYRLFEAEVEQMAAERPWLRHNYPINAIRAEHLWLVSILMGVQPLTKPEHIEDWIQRLETLPAQLERSADELEERAARGVSPPPNQWEPSISGGQRLLTGDPFSGDEPSPLLGAFVSKLEAMDALTPDQRAAHTERVRGVLVDAVGPAMSGYLDILRGLAARATDEPAASRLPDGEAYYRHQLRLFTNTELDADEIHAIGLAEVERIHAELAALQQQLGVDGDLQAFFEHLRTHEPLTLSNDDEGRRSYLEKARQTIAAVEQQLDAVMTLRPRAPLTVKRVEPYRERATGKAFYERGSVDGTRAAVLYVNLADMSDVPTYQLPALAYHEGIPGHHLQLGLAQELQDLPAFRRTLDATAWTEGWGLYAERLPKELGLYTDPYDDAGRLALELWRASRLVVDTGLHHKGWTRQQAIDWLQNNTPNPSTDASKAVDRYIAWPGQATAYTMGMLEILRLRARAEERLGPAFSITSFHDAILRDGPMPMHILGEQVEAWIVSQENSTAPI